jgi:hypothetical protein
MSTPLAGVISAKAGESEGEIGVRVPVLSLHPKMVGLGASVHRWLNFLKSQWPKNRKALETNHGDTETQRREGREAARRTSLRSSGGWIHLD